MRKPIVFAIANGNWLGRHEEIMRTMPYAHFLLFPIHRVIAQKVIFRASTKKSWEVAFAEAGLEGLALVVEQACGGEAIREYPPADLRGSFQTIFVGLDPDDTKKSLTLPVYVKLWEAQDRYLRGCNGPNKHSTYNKQEVETWKDGQTPPVIQRTFVDVPEADEESPEDEGEIGTKYRGPVDSTAAAQEHGDHTEDTPWTFLCPDAADQDLSGPSLIQAAGAKLQSMEKTAKAIKQETELAVYLNDKVNGRHLLNETVEFRKLLTKMTGDSYVGELEQALQSECPTPAAFQKKDEKKEEQVLVVPTRRKYANLWEPGFWQECFPTCWVHGDCLYADPKRNEPPYKQMNYKQFCKMILLMEELEYDVYPGENYKAECYGANHWQHQRSQAEVDELLRRHEQATRKEKRDAVMDGECFFRVNRFRKVRLVLFVLSTFWRLISGFTAVNVGLRIPGVQRKLRDLAELPTKLIAMAAESAPTDGAMDLVRSARHLFDLIQGKVVGSDGYRISCRHQFSAYTIFCGPPIVFCTPNLADTRNFTILLTQGESVNLDVDADMELQICYEQLCVRVAFFFRGARTDNMFTRQDAFLSPQKNAKAQITDVDHCLLARTIVY